MIICVVVVVFCICDGQLQELADEKERSEMLATQAKQAEATASTEAKAVALAAAVASGTYAEMDLRSDLLGVIIGKKKAHLMDIMSSTGTTITVDSVSGKCAIKKL